MYSVGAVLDAHLSFTGYNGQPIPSTSVRQTLYSLQVSVSYFKFVNLSNVFTCEKAGSYSGSYLIQAEEPDYIYDALPATDILLPSRTPSLNLTFSALCFRYSYSVT